ncbi:hypothetical protein VRB95_15850 [Erwinia aphidicola]|uniref:phage tail fiber protein n=1 Tax=Erwinia aphidicola TaxID=68334 RepID=UPI0030D4A700
MPAGTIALTNNSTTVGGTGTAFTTELKVGDFIGVTVGGAPYTMIVASISSNTQLTIAQAYNGPTASGLAWYGVPATLKYAITQQVLNDIATNQRGMIAQLANWQKIYSDAASVTVERPDRSTFTGPSWGYMSAQYANKASLVNGAVPISQGGTGGKTAAEARSGLGLGSSATRDAYSGSGQMLSVGDFGLGAYGVPLDNANGGRISAIYAATGASSINFFDAYSAILTICRNGSVASQLQPTTDGRLALRGCNSGIWTNWYEVWSTRNTTVDTNNFIKRASPIARLTNDVSQMQDDFAVDEQHVVAGLVSVNAEAEGVSAEKTAVGVYQVKGAIGLADEGWTLEVPQDINGNRLCFVELATD